MAAKPGACLSCRIASVWPTQICILAVIARMSASDPSRTFGNLLKQIRKIGSVSEDIEKIINEAHENQKLSGSQILPQSQSTDQFY